MTKTCEKCGRPIACPRDWGDRDSCSAGKRYGTPSDWASHERDCDVAREGFLRGMAHMLELAKREVVIDAGRPAYGDGCCCQVDWSDAEAALEKEMGR